MKKGQQIIAIIGLWMATLLVLGASFVKYYKAPQKNEVAIDSVIDEKETEIDDESTTETEFEFTGFVPGDESYFEDALIIGDSRSLGIKEYGNLEGATFFVKEAMSIYNLWKKELPVGELGEITLEKLLESHTYGKIYIMLGYNELGYDANHTAERYKETLDRIHEMEPDAIIYICSNLHVTEELSSVDAMYNNEKINIYNKKLEAFADQKTYFYLEVNGPFDDENGNLRKECSGDKVHLYAKYYREWSEWFCNHTVGK